MADLSWYITALFCAFMFALCWLCWCYWKLINTFKTFPAERLDVKWFKIMIGRLPKDITFGSLVFQELIRSCRSSLREGICVVWFVFPYFFFYNEELNKRLFTEPAVVGKMFFYDTAGDIFGNGLLTSDEVTWRKHRKLLNPAFYLAVLKGKMQIFDENARDLVKKLEGMTDQTTEELHGLLQTCAFNIMSESILGLKISDEKYGPKIAKYMKSLEELFGHLIFRSIVPWLRWNTVLRFYPEGRRYLKNCDEVHSFTKEVILEMKKAVVVSETPVDTADVTRECRKSFAHILIEQHLKDPTFTIKNIQDEVNTVMIAGHDTLSWAMMWCLYLLGLNPEIQERALGEINTIAGEEVTYDDLSKLTYLECVIKETLRLYPVLPIYGRKLSKDIQNGESIIPKGTNLIFFTYMLHRNPNIYFNPEKFEPERFSENSETRPWTYLPFSEGYRSCIGKRFAIMEMKVLLVHILRRFSIATLRKVEESELEWKIFLAPTKPVKMLWTLRQ